MELLNKNTKRVSRLCICYYLAKMERPSLKRQGKISIVLFVFEIFVLTMYVVFIDYGDELLPVETSDPKHELGKDSIPINGMSVFKQRDIL